MRVTKPTRMRRVEHVVYMRLEMSTKFWSRTEETTRKTWRRSEGNIKMDLIKIKCEGVVWIRMAQDRVQWWTLGNTVMNLGIP
jgi:hypothetical protein